MTTLITRSLAIATVPVAGLASFPRLAAAQEAAAEAAAPTANAADTA